MSGLTPNGFDRKRISQIKTELEEAFKLIFGDNIDLDPQSGFGQAIGIASEAASDQWESQENVYNSQYPSTAQGDQLSNVVLLNGIERQRAANSTVTATFTGTIGTTIDAGTQVATSDTNSSFETISIATIGSGGTVNINMQSVETGPIEAIAGTLTVIKTPIFGLNSVTNALDADLGRDEETDAELRIRREESTSASGQNLTDSLFGQLLDIDDVFDAVVVSNGSDTTSPEGIPPHQFLSVISGGDVSEIAQTIWNNTPQGIASYGDLTETITDDQGFLQDIKYSRPDLVPIYFDVDISTGVGFPVDGVNEIKQSIANYGTNNFKISDDVILSQFYTPINNTPGIESIIIRIGKTPAPVGTSNITILFDELSTYDIANIEVNIV